MIKESKAQARTRCSSPHEIFLLLRDVPQKLSLEDTSKLCIKLELPEPLLGLQQAQGTSGTQGEIPAQVGVESLDLFSRYAASGTYKLERITSLVRKMCELAPKVYEKTSQRKGPTETLGQFEKRVRDLEQHMDISFKLFEDIRNTKEGSKASQLTLDSVKILSSINKKFESIVRKWNALLDSSFYYKKSRSPAPSL